MDKYDYIQLLGGTLLAISYLPQIIKTQKTKSVKDFSLLFWGMVFVALALMGIYAVHLISEGVYSYAMTQIPNIILCGVIVVQILAFRKRDGGE